MTGSLINKPQPHYCRPGWTEYVITDHEVSDLNGRTGLRPPDTGIRDGSVWRCTCGRTWVAHRDVRRGHYPGLLAPSFRREGRFERWRRERREAR